MKRQNIFFIEKPVTHFELLDVARNFRFREDSVYYVACPLRYTNVVRYLKDKVNVSDVISVRCISSSYLPDWRPGIDYRNTYSAHKEQGGGVSIDLIHEWDYIQYLFGEPKNIYYAAGKKSNLEIDSEDYAVYVADYKDKVVELHLDYFGRKTLREIMIFTNEETIVGDLVNGSIRELRSGKELFLPELRNDYQIRELQSFFKMIDGQQINTNSIKDACKTLGYTRGIIE